MEGAIGAADWGSEFTTVILTMSTAFREFDPVSDDWTRDFLNKTPDHYPGTIFNYDSMGTHTLCEIIQKRVGTSLHEYLTPRLFEPLGIAANEVRWSKSKYGINQGGGGAAMLYLSHHFKWAGSISRPLV